MLTYYIHTLVNPIQTLLHFSWLCFVPLTCIRTILNYIHAYIYAYIYIYLYMPTLHTLHSYTLCMPPRLAIFQCCTTSGPRRVVMWPASPSRKIPYLELGTLIKSAIAHTSNFTISSRSLPEKQSKANLIIISSIISRHSRRKQSYCNGEQAKEILLTFVLPLKAAEEPKHQHRVITGLGFQQYKRVLADPFAVPMD